MRKIFAAAIILATAMFAALPAGTLLAEGPGEGRGQTVLTVVAPSEHTTADSLTLTARLHDESGTPVGGATVVFYELSTVFGERLMEVGKALTDSTGTASLAHHPTWPGEHTVVVRYGGTDQNSPSQKTFRFNSTAPPHQHENAKFGLEVPRKWAPIGIGLLVLAVWGTLGLALMRAVLGISGLGPVAGAIPLPTVRAPIERMREPLRPASLTPVIVLLTGLTVLAFPIGWALPRGGAEEVPAWTRVPPGRVSDTTALDHAFPATLVEAITATRMDDSGRLSRDSADLPSDVALIGDRVLVLDTNKGRVMTLTSEGKLARTFESDRGGRTSLLRALAITAHRNELYIAAPLFGNIVVMSSEGHVDRVIEAQVPEGIRRFHPAGIAVSNHDRIWVSDSSNHRVVQLSDTGVFISSIGQGLVSSERDGLDKPAGLALDISGNLLVADSGNRVVKKYSPLGIFLGAIGKEQLSNPQAVTIDDRGTIFVSDSDLRAVLVFGPDGSFLGSIAATSESSSGSSLQYPAGLAVNGNRLYVVDRLSGVFVFDLKR